ncbi:MAG TPA: heme-copper oxidase subunit III [Candidatus Xenobia bacterium]|nr:heme-copper oxidase subunit III [Candidatus Xenobia bacterium]
MTAKSAIEELELIDTAEPPPPTRRGDSGWDGGEGFRHARARDPETYVTGIWVALASILMFFLALTSSFLVRKGLGQDWQPFEFPRALWVTTALLVVSSGTLERARRALTAGERAVFSRWWTLTTMLGVFFLAGQLVAWRSLWNAGVFLATNPSSSFFYLLTGTHGLHLLGGLIALSYVSTRSRRLEPWPAERPAVTATAIYWHFLGVLWVFLFLLLLLGR